MQTFNQLEEVLLDVEQTLNNRPLSNSLMLGIQNHIPTMENRHNINDKDLKKD